MERGTVHTWLRFEGSDVILPRGLRMSIPRSTYGTILLLAVIVPLADRVPGMKAREVFAVLLAAAVVFWAAHVYSAALGARIAEGGLTRVQFRALMASESALLLVAIAPLTVVALAGIGVLDLESALDIAAWLGVGTLFLWGYAAGRASGLRWPGAVVMALVDAAFGAALVALELSLTH